MNASFNLFCTAISDKIPDISAQKVEAFRSLSSEHLDLLTIRLRALPNHTQVREQASQLRQGIWVLGERKKLPLSEIFNRMFKRQFSPFPKFEISYMQKQLLKQITENADYIKYHQAKEEFENLNYEVNLPLEIWEEIFSHLSYEKLRPLKFLNRATLAERKKRYERGECTLQDYGCWNLKDAIQCIHEYGFSRASLEGLEGENLLELIRKCPNLKEIFFSSTVDNCYAWVVPPEITQLTHLETVGLTQPSELLDQFLHLPNLRKLIYKDFIGGKYQDPRHHPRIFQMSQLETLVLPTSEPLPSEIQNLTNLKHLDLSGSMIETLPAEMENLQNLRTLDLRRTPIRKLPNLLTLEALKVSLNPFFHQGELLDRMSKLREIVVCGVSFSPETLKSHMSSCRTSSAEEHLKRALPELLFKVTRGIYSSIPMGPGPFIQRVLASFQRIALFNDKSDRNLLQVCDWIAQL